MKKNRVLLVSPYSSKKVGGIGTWSKNVIDYSKENNIKICFLNTAFLFKSNIVKNKFSRIVLGSIDSLWILIRLFFNLLFKRPSVVHYTSSGSYALYKDILAAYISILFAADFIIHFRFGRIPELYLQQNKEWKLLVKVINLSTKCIAIDKKSYDIISVVDISKVFLIPNMISLSLEQIARQSNAHTRKFITGKVVFVGHVIVEKGILELIKTCSKIKEVKELNIIGPYSETMMHELKKIASMRNDGNWLQLHGENNREYVINVIRDSNVLCLPSHTEGFPNVVLESMACACPVIATKVGAIEEMLNVYSNKPAGICIMPGRQDQLEDALLKIINDQVYAKMLADNALSRVLNYYSQSKVMPQLLNLWNF